MQPFSRDLVVAVAWRQRITTFVKLDWLEDLGESRVSRWTNRSPGKMQQRAGL
jgi:hypothetical protein